MISPPISLKSRKKVTVPPLIEQEFALCTFPSTENKLMLDQLLASVFLLLSLQITFIGNVLQMGLGR